MAENKDHLWKSPEDAPEKIEDLVKGGSHPVGIDVGTSKVVGLAARAARTWPAPRS